MKYRLFLPSIILMLAYFSPIAATQDATLVAQVGHSAEVNGVAISNNRQLALTTSPDSSVRLWSLATGDELRRLKGHTGQVGTIAFSHDDNLAVTGSYDDSSRVWDVANGKQIALLQRPGSKGYEQSVKLVRFLPGDRQVLTLALDGDISLWDRDANWARTQIDHLPNGIMEASASRDAQTVAAVERNTGDFWVWQLTSSARRDQVTVTGITGYIKTVNVSGDGRRVLITYSSPTDGVRSLIGPTRMMVIEIATDKRQDDFPLPTDVMAAVFTDEPDRVLINDSEGGISLWSLSEAKQTHIYLPPRGKNAWGNLISKADSISQSNDGSSFLAGSWDGVARYWNVHTGDLLKALRGNVKTPRRVTLSRDGRELMLGFSDGSASVWSLTKGNRTAIFQLAPTEELTHTGGITGVALSPDGRFAVAAGGGVTSAWSVADKKKIDLPYRSYADDIAFLDDGSLLQRNPAENHVYFIGLSTSPKNLIGAVWRVAVSSNGRRGLSMGAQGAAILDLILGTSEQLPVHENVTMTAISDSAQIGITEAWNGAARVWNLQTKKQIAELEGANGVTNQGYTKSLRNTVLSADGGLVAAVLNEETDQNTVSVWSTYDGKLLGHLAGHLENIDSMAISRDGGLLATAAGDGVKLWDVQSKQEIATLTESSDQQSLAAAPNQRFDVASLEENAGIRYVFENDPLKTWAVEIFMRDYYEPQLLPRLMACKKALMEHPDACETAFNPVGDLSKLNRIQPDVKIVDVRRGARADEAIVTAEALGKEDKTQPNGKTHTKAYDLRLFRNGQLVGQWPVPKGSTGGPENLREWEKVSEVPTPTHEFHVPLATKDAGQPVRFTAYAFNEDRVKSETREPKDPYLVPKDVTKRQARAYVITVGVNGYQNRRRNLEFAVKDARDLSQALRQIKDYEVVRVSLLSEAPLGAQGKLDQATKQNVRAALRVLGGHSDDIVQLHNVLNHDQLKRATPDDLVILAFSGHGYTERNRSFYLLPSNSGKGNDITPDSLKDFISSEELSEWLREVDAGHMAMIIDACHSAASVKTPGFKPGPMGDRGLGQLAYDKGMQILAASQADDVALEIENLHQGLLTFALREGLLPGKEGKLPAASQGEVTLQSWLHYAEQRVPDLYDDAKTGKVHMISRDPHPNPNFLDSAAKKAQTPSLFDFTRRNSPVQLK